jgi:drug/metabolite transporter (DMT)-like permease
VALLTGGSVDLWNLSGADAYALLGALFAAIVIVAIRKLHERESTATIFAAQCSWGLLLTAVPTAMHPHAPGWIAFGLLVISGLLAGGGQLTMTAGYKVLPVAEGSLYQALLPVGIAAGGIGFFDEHFSSREAAGALLIVASCVLAARSRPRLAAGLPAAPAR